MSLSVADPPCLRTPHRNSKIDIRSPQGRELDVLWILPDHSQVAPRFRERKPNEKPKEKG